MQVKFLRMMIVLLLLALVFILTILGVYSFIAII
jgi:hypothetical protein